MKAVVVDENLCLACKQCMVECAMAHSDARTLVEAVTGPTPAQPRVHVEPPGASGVGYGMPLQCRHCEEAPCLAVCPTGAVYRTGESGPVLLDTDRCIGCKFCVFICPFGVIDLSPDGKAAVKCDQCIERTEAGAEPACVAGCPTGALRFQEIDEWLAERRRRAASQIASARAKEAAGP